MATELSVAVPDEQQHNERTGWRRKSLQRTDSQDRAAAIHSRLVAVRKGRETLELGDAVDSQLLAEVNALDSTSKRELLRVLRNMPGRGAGNNGVVGEQSAPDTHLAGQYLSGIGRDRDHEFEILSHNVARLKSFDLLLFRGSDFVSNFILRLTQKHRGVNTFSHVGLLLKAPLVPKHGHYLRGSAVNSGQKMLSFVQIQLRFRPDTSSLQVTVLQCRGLPSVLDEGGTKEDPFVRVSLSDTSTDAAHSEEHLLNVWQRFGLDGSGKLSEGEVRKVLEEMAGRQITNAEFEADMVQLDADVSISTILPLRQPTPAGAFSVSCVVSRPTGASWAQLPNY